MSILIDRIAEEILKPKVRGTKKGDSWHPSSASVVYNNTHGELTTVGKCLRQQYYKRAGYEEKEEVNVQGLLKAIGGDVWSEYFTNIIKQAGFWIGDEVSFYDPRLNVSGRIDYIISEEGTNLPIGVDLKTTGRFLKDGVITPTGTKPLAPKEDHVLQMMLYLYYWQQHGIDKWVIVYMDRDGFDMTEHVVRLDKEDDGSVFPIVSNDMGTMEWKHLRIQDIISRWADLAEALKSGTVPDRDYSIQYDNEKIKLLFERGQLNKTEKGMVARKLQKGPLTNEMPPAIKKGDWQCRFCPFVEECYAEPADDTEVHADQLNATS